MSVSTIKARLEAHDQQRMLYGYSDETAPQIWERNLRALLRVAEAAKQYIYGSDGDERVDYSALCAALAELEGME
jgi:hypothetical protein